MTYLHETERAIRVATGSVANVLILGPTGTGKTRLAKQIHDQGCRSGRPFIAINLAALHEGTIESELFGHERGAFTGADRKRKGLLEVAEGGTVLLDEIGELPLRLQARLLEFLQSRTITPVGATKPVRLDVRVIAATHRNLSSAVLSGEFREDLFHRLRVVQIELKSIARRWQELDHIIHECLEEVSRNAGRSILRLSENVARRLECYSWPGNFRELRNVLEYAVHAGNGPEILEEDLPAWFGASAIPERTAESFDSETRKRQETTPRAEALNFHETVAAYEKGLISKYLKICDGNVSRAARMFGMDKTTLLRRIRLYGLGKADARIPFVPVMGKNDFSRSRPVEKPSIDCLKAAEILGKAEINQGRSFF